MPKRPDFTLQLSLKNSEDLLPPAIARSPRNYRLQDVIRSCKNLNLEPLNKDTPPEIISLAHFISIDFFGLSFESGLHNRQIKLWEALTKTNSIEVQVLSKGFLQKTKQPEFDLEFLNKKSELLSMAHYACPENPTYDYLRDCREFIQRATLKQGLSGLFICYPAPFPKTVFDFIKAETKASNTLTHYESIYPKLGIPLNLLEIQSNAQAKTKDAAHLNQIRLVLPDIYKQKE